MVILLWRRLKIDHELLFDSQFLSICVGPVATSRVHSNVRSNITLSEGGLSSRQEVLVVVGVSELGSFTEPSLYRARFRRQHLTTGDPGDGMDL